jgi:predicted nucleic acid-binding protein
VKLFLDANILFTAAHNEKGISRGLFRLAERGICSLVTSAYAVDEAQRNITRKYPALRGELDSLLADLTLVREPQPSTVAAMATLPLADKDAPILAAAVECHADCLVTGDRRDFGHLFGRVIEGVLVLKPGDAMEKVLGG